VDLAGDGWYTPTMADYPDIEALHAALSRCRLCAEAGHRIESQPICSGKQSARLMVIGQAPGASEAHLGHPFGGDAGQRLFRWLERAGWDEETFRRTCYITSVTKCFPGSNPKGEGDRVPSAAERKLCRPWLEGELALVQPEVIVPVGRLAVDLFYPSKVRLGDVVGESAVDAEGRHVVPLPHPSGASRWLNDPINVGRVEQAIYTLRTLKADLGL
jgi:uracil-DNA glycosylase family 4